MTDLDYTAMHTDLMAAAQVLEERWRDADGPWVAHGPSGDTLDLWCGGAAEARALSMMDDTQEDHWPYPDGKRPRPFTGDVECPATAEWIALASLFGPVLPTMLREVANHVRLHRPEPLAARDATLLDLARQVIAADRLARGAVRG